MLCDSFVLKGVNPPSHIIHEYSIFQFSWNPAFIVVLRSMIEECLTMVGNIALHIPKSFAFGRPPTIQFPSLWEEIDIQNPSACVTQKMAFVGGKGLIPHHSTHTCVDVGESSHTADIPFRQLLNREGIGKNHPVKRVIKFEYSEIEMRFAQLCSRKPRIVVFIPDGDPFLPVRQCER